MKYAFFAVAAALTGASFWAFPSAPALAAAAGDKGPDEPVFRFSLSVDPQPPDPRKITSSESNYFLVNIYRGLFFTDGEGRLQPEIAEHCTWQKKHIVLKCRLKKGVKWSDGSPITATQFVDSWRRLQAKTSKGLGFQLLSNLKAARTISDRDLEVILKKSDPEFMEVLAHPALVATKSDADFSRDKFNLAPVSGPYRVTHWKTGAGQKLRLESNPYYETIRPTKVARPPVEILRIDDDETAFNLYREGTLTFLRRLPTHYLKSWSTSKELHQIPVQRFDYIGFGTAMRDHPALRKALSKSLKYEELQQIYSALGRPGCPSMDPKWMEQTPCHEFDLEEAKRLWATLPEELKKRRWELHFSSLGGDDVKTGMEWIQNQWKKNLGANVDLKPQEQAVYLAALRVAPADIFRKGVGLDRATCLAAVEIFSKEDPENFIRLNSETYEKALNELRNAPSASMKKRACTKVVKLLIDDAEIIPMGRIHFSVLAKPLFKGWKLNPLNQLDLSELRVSDLD